jgi:pimeloyl-ACP methyl ester carboxylesterase
MANFVLVHGAWHGGWIWKRVARRLRDEGHDVYTPTMTGLGERKHLLNAAINLSTHIQDIVNVIRFEKLSDVVLCGHSYAGMVISGVADQISERIASLFYLDAFVPEDGNSIFTLSPESIQLSRIKDAGRYGGLTVPPIPAEVFRVNKQDRAWIDEMCTPHPLATMIEAIRLQGNHLKVKSKTYVLASGWESGPFKQFYERIRKDSGWITRAIESGGHCAMLDQPDDVSNLLRNTALDVTRQG